MPVSEFDFTTLKDYVTSSKDNTLRDIAQKTGKRYRGSSSSMTSVLSHFHFLLSAWRRLNPSAVSRCFPDRSTSFTRIARAPAAIILRYQDGQYAIDADKEFDSAHILMHLGRSMEKLLTRPKDEYERYRRSSKNKISAEEENSVPESYHYSTQGDFVMRSQLDARDPRLPGTGMFDLKTRAVVSIRMDAVNYEKNLGYEIRKLPGPFESYEREFFDMVRSTFLKYSLQARIGRMDGIFVAFHNVERIFGFQYFSLAELDTAIHGQYNTVLGDREFQFSLDLWNKVLNAITAKYPGQSIRMHFEARETSTPYMNIFAKPVTDEEISAIQTKNKAQFETRERRLLGLPDPPSTQDSTSQESQEPMDPERTEEQQHDEKQRSSSSTTEKGNKSEVMGLRLFITNKVNGAFVERPRALRPTDKWSVGYKFSEMDPSMAPGLYTACKSRRKKLLAQRDAERNTSYYRLIRAFSQRGRAFRNRQDKRDQKQGIVVLGESDEP